MSRTTSKLVETGRNNWLNEYKQMTNKQKQFIIYKKQMLEIEQVKIENIALKHLPEST